MRRIKGRKKAGDETRTRDIHDGNVKLYQLSYARKVLPDYALHVRLSNVFWARVRSTYMLVRLGYFYGDAAWRVEEIDLPLAMG